MKLGMNLGQIQREQLEWATRNFGPSDVTHPLLGILEELRELREANGIEETQDAIADCGIFGLHFASLHGLDIDDLQIDISFFEGITQAYLKTDQSHLRRLIESEALSLCHPQLKLIQGIRGTPSEHKKKIAQHIAGLFCALSALAKKNNFDLPDQITKTWNQVKQRDFKKFPKNGRTE